MSAIMQGTTPSLTISISKEDFELSSVSKIELYIQNGNKVTTYRESDLVIDNEKNSFTKKFTESETAAFVVKNDVIAQARFWFPDGSIVGIKKIAFSVSDMLGV